MGLKSRIKRMVNKLKKEVKTPIYIPAFSGMFLENKTVLITGGTGGIGYAIAERCLENGASIIITGRDKDKLYEAIERLNQKKLSEEQSVVPMLLDLKKIKTIRTAINKVMDTYSIQKMDILINNAGISCGQAIGKTTEEDFDNVLATNMKGTYFISQEFSNYLIENNIQGNILNISSVSGIRPVITPYMLSKWGVTGLTEGLAKKLIKYGIVVNGIAPGPTATEMLSLDGNDLYYEKSPATRYVDPVEVANLAVFMVSDMGRMIVGDTVYITGGCGNLTMDDISY